MNIQSLVQDTMLHDAVALLGCNAAGTKRVPGGLDVALDPFLDFIN